jgi:hypothetical protein
MASPATPVTPAVPFFMVHVFAAFVHRAPFLTAQVGACFQRRSLRLALVPFGHEP